VRLPRDRGQPRADDDEIEREIDADERDGDTDGLIEAAQEDRAQERDQEQRHQDLVPMERPRVGVFPEVRRRVRGREGDRDDEASGHETDEAEHEELTLPPGEQAFEHGDGPVAVGARRGHAAVHREGSAERNQHEDERGDGGKDAGGKGRDARRVAQRGEVVDAGQAHHPPPRVLVGRGLLVGTFALPGRVSV